MSKVRSVTFSSPTEHPVCAKNIILVGMMGCGKSTIGKILSKMLAYPFVDTDHQIEILQHRSITNIFQTEGEAYFRQCEYEFVKSLINKNVHKHIISTGGGLPINSKSNALLPQLGYVVWLHAHIETLHERTSKNSNRPLLKGTDPLKTLKKIYKERKDQYSNCAHLKINTENLDINDIATGILESARFHFSRQEDGC